MVPRALRCADRCADGRLAADRQRARHADQRSDRLRQDPRRLPRRHRRLVRKAEAGTLEDVTEIVYVTPLKALGNDIQRNLETPPRGDPEVAAELGLEPPAIRTAVRSGDTTQSERQAMVRKPPHILITTPESLYLLITAERSRENLRRVRTRDRRRDPRGRPRPAKAATSPSRWRGSTSSLPSPAASGPRASGSRRRSGRSRRSRASSSAPIASMRTASRTARSSTSATSATSTSPSSCRRLTSRRSPRPSSGARSTSASPS